MKRVISVIAIIAVIITSILSVYAESFADFTVESVSSEPNRIINIPVKCEYSGKLSAAVFDFSYDKALLEFRGAETDNNSKVKSAETDSGIKIVYYNYSGVTAAENTIFNLNFKTLNMGKTDIAFSVSGTVDSGANPISPGRCTSGTVEIQKQSAGSSSTGKSSATDKSSSAKTKSQSSKLDSKAENDDEEEESTLENLGTINDVSGKASDNSILVYILIAIGIIILLFTGIKIGTVISAKKRDKTNKN